MMPRVPFPAYRDHEASRVEANDAMMALLVGSRLSRHALGLMTGSKVFLPQIFPQLDDVRRLNVQVGDAQRLLEDAEEHLAHMAIPYSVSVHEDFVNRCIDMLMRSNGDEPESLDYRKRSLVRLHATLDELGAHGLESLSLELFELIRRVRNQIIHDQARVGDVLIYVESMSDNARASWRKSSGRELAETDSGRIQVGSNELFAVLGVLKHIADQVNLSMQTAVSADAWACIAAEDFLATHPRGLNQPQAERKMRGFVRRFYGALPDNEAIVERAVEHALP